MVFVLLVDVVVVYDIINIWGLNLTCTALIFCFMCTVIVIFFSAVHMTADFDYLYYLHYICTFPYVCPVFNRCFAYVDASVLYFIACMISLDIMLNQRSFCH
jgi:hypothetical protein